MRAMLLKFVLLGVLLTDVYILDAQSKTSIFRYADLNFGVGSREGTLAASAGIDWLLGKKSRFALGTGIRLTSYLGKNRYYVTAPAELTSGTQGPFVIFTENIPANMDTLLIQTSRVDAVNLLINLGYHFTDRIYLCFNIDAIGFSFGKQVTGDYINGTQTAKVDAKPTAFNLLLTSDNDVGSLNSEFVMRYKVSDSWYIKGGPQFLFTEFTTDTEIQQYPQPNDRFRKKSLMFTVGITRKL